MKNEKDNKHHAEKQTNKLWGVIERAQAFVTKGDEPVTVRPEKIHAELEKTSADPDFVRYMISRKDLDYDGVFGGEDRTWAWTPVIIICRPTHTLFLFFSLSPSFSLTYLSLSFFDSLCLFFTDISWLKLNFLISID